jgi:hypothetical protein
MQFSERERRVDQKNPNQECGLARSCAQNSGSHHLGLPLSNCFMH